MAIKTIVVDANPVKKATLTIGKNDFSNLSQEMNLGTGLCRAMDIGAVDANAVKKSPRHIGKNDLSNSSQGTNLGTAPKGVTYIGNADAPSAKKPTEFLLQPENTVFQKMLLNKF